MLKYILIFLAIFNSTCYANDVVDKLNSANSHIQTIQADIHVTTMRDRGQVSADGTLVYDKQRSCIRVLTKGGPLNKVVTDMGQNNQYCWFWSRRVDGVFYYWDVKDSERVKLPGDINPKWMMDTLNTHLLDENDGRVVIQGGNLFFLTSVGGQTRVIGIDQRRPAMLSHRSYDVNNNVVAESVVEDFIPTSFGGYLPKRTRIKIKSEKLTILWSLDKVRCNEHVPDGCFLMPNYTDKRKL